MNITITCACGRQQSVSTTLAGQSTACAGCGQPLRVPAMGVAVPTAKRSTARAPATPFAELQASPPAPTADRRLPRRAPAALALIGSGVLLLLAAGVALWQLHTPANVPTIEPVVQVASPPVHAPPIYAPPVHAPPEAPEPAPPVNKLAPAELVAPGIPTPSPVQPPPINRPVPEPRAPAPAINKPVLGAAPVAVAKPLPRLPVVALKIPVPVRPVPFKEGDTFRQELVVTQRSRFLVLGQPVATQLKYGIASHFTVQKALPDGSLTVQQKIESAALLQADDLTKGLLAGPVQRLPGTALIMHVSPRGEVTKLEGAAGMPQFGAAKVPGGAGVQMASLLDADGYKELGQAVFYQPEQFARPGFWTRPMMHNWGPLGGWVGQVTYGYPGPDNGPQVKVPYVLKLAYQPPRGPGMAGPLPVVASTFQPAQAAGTLLFDTQQGKTIAAEERFVVRGTLVLMLLGQKMPAEIEEEQLFQMRIVAK